MVSRGAKKEAEHLDARAAEKNLDVRNAGDLRYSIATALFAGGDDHIAPVRDTLFRAVGGQLDHGAGAGDRQDFRNAELRGLLQGRVHAVAARYALSERDRERGLALRGVFGQDARERISSGNSRKLGREFAAAAVEQ